MPDQAARRSGDDAHRAFESAGAVLRGHFVYTSGRHGADYLEKFRILEDPKATTELARMIAERFRPLRPELVAGPTTGGIILAYEVARQLGVDAVYAERGESGGRVLRRGFEISPGTRVVVVDDVVTTGGSVAETQTCIASAGGVVIGIGVLADRTAGRAATDVPFFACLTVDFPSYAPDACPLCANGIPVASPRGSGKIKLPSPSGGGSGWGP
ncbi:MAG TPA: orotate phosphoribosyltransferase [Candidatus Dormibacteraeota bacterium]|nr:orotate phosphoribosyltransferase [Candidatus Dormibacteraeota bacterium]